MEPCTGLKPAAPQGEAALQMEILGLRQLVAELLLKNQLLRLGQLSGQAVAESLISRSHP